MNSYEDFLKELEGYSTYELELIYETQQDLYTKEEMNIIIRKLEERNAEEADPIKSKMNCYTKEEREKIESMLPDKIECPKCEGPNAFSNDRCEFCGADLEKEAYYSLEYYENGEVENSDSGNMFRYFVSFLIPLVGFIMGAILLSKDDIHEKSAGKNCIILALISVVLATIIWVLYVEMVFSFLL